MIGATNTPATASTNPDNRNDRIMAYQLGGTATAIDCYGFAGDNYEDDDPDFATREGEQEKRNHDHYMNEYQNKLYLAKGCKVPEVDVEKVVSKRFGYNKERVQK